MYLSTSVHLFATASPELNIKEQFWGHLSNLLIYSYYYIYLVLPSVLWNYIQLIIFSLCTLSMSYNHYINISAFRVMCQLKLMN